MQPAGIDTTVFSSAGSQREERVFGMECSVTFASTESSEDTGIIENESEHGMALQLDDATRLHVGGFLMVSDFDGDRLGLIRHITPTNSGYSVGLEWQL